jgi:preprotein translocase subunit SecF
MELIPAHTNIDFIGKWKLCCAVSAVFILVCLAATALRGGPRYGVDFAGGTLVQVRLQKPVETGEVRAALDGVVEGTVVVQSLGEGTEFVIQLEETSAELEVLSGKLRDALAQRLDDDGAEIRRLEMVGPKVGKDLREKGALAVVVALGATLLYIWWRFELRFGVGAIVALIHDVLVTVGALALLGKPFDLNTVAAVLTIVGYSLNDTIVVFDRVREALRKAGGKADLASVLNRSVNETLSRTILTSGTTLLVVIPLFLLGGPVLHDFAFALLVGIVAGTYSTVYIAGPVVLLLERRAAGRDEHPAPVAVPPGRATVEGTPGGGAGSR